jgi:hypothetical protein
MRHRLQEGREIGGVFVGRSVVEALLRQLNGKLIQAISITELKVADRADDAIASGNWYDMVWVLFPDVLVVCH